ncbi:hypothetical protein [Peteryoungia ipomoeae]|uniref:hypothetical protein n=1 Tax=Peteryoungia ipomoeae TaxID=1210932 RepID=UPI00197D5895|nr:hypothetical protein [Peteryoungia ipomoeae]
MDAEDGDALGLFEVKGLSGSEDFEGLLAGFMTEMRAQFDLFRRLRESAERLLAPLSDGADEAAAKLARADIKTATDAIALIVRTLEKIDALMRQLARDRAEAEERQLGDRDPEVLRAEVEALIAARVAAVVAERLAVAEGVGDGALAEIAEGRGPP